VGDGLNVAVPTIRALALAGRPVISANGLLEMVRRRGLTAVGLAVHEPAHVLLVAPRLAEVFAPLLLQRHAGSCKAQRQGALKQQQQQETLKTLEPE